MQKIMKIPPESAKRKTGILNKRDLQETWISYKVQNCGEKINQPKE